MSVGLFCPGFTESIRGSLVPWYWSFMRLWAATWVLWFKSWPSKRAASSLKHWLIFQTLPSGCFLIYFITIFAGIAPLTVYWIPFHQLLIRIIPNRQNRPRKTQIACFHLRMELAYKLYLCVCFIQNSRDELSSNGPWRRRSSSREGEIEYSGIKE